MTAATTAEARPARCSTSDDGSYPCDFRVTGRDGSFVISARAKPTYYVNTNGSGGAFVHADFGTGRKGRPPGAVRPQHGGSGLLGS